MQRGRVDPSNDDTAVGSSASARGNVTSRASERSPGGSQCTAFLSQPSPCRCCSAPAPPWPSQATGTVESVDPNTKTVVVNGQPYMLEGQAAGLKIDEIKVGEKVTVEFDVNTNNVSQIDHAK